MEVEGVEKERYEAEEMEKDLAAKAEEDLAAEETDTRVSRRSPRSRCSSGRASNRCRNRHHRSRRHPYIVRTTRRSKKVASRLATEGAVEKDSAEGA
eukprot:1900031-Pleurochrysis_carterae.AAC.1